MKKVLIVMLMAVLLCVGLSSITQAETKISGSVDVGYLSSYMGTNSGGVIYDKAVSQQSVSLSASLNSFDPFGVYAILWSSYSPKGGFNEDYGDEVDYIVGVYRTYGNFGFDLSYSYYDMIEIGDSEGDLHAVILKTDFPSVLSVKPYLTVEGNIPQDKDICEGGLTYRLGGVYSPGIAGKEVNFNLSVSGHDGIYGTEPEALDSARISVSTAFNVGKIWLKPELNYQVRLGKSIEEGGLSDNNNFWWGVKASYTF